MDMRSRISSGLKDAMKSKDTARLSTLRLINAAIKDKEIALRGEDGRGRGDGCRRPGDPWQDGQAAP